MSIFSSKTIIKEAENTQKTVIKTLKEILLDIIKVYKFIEFLIPFQLFNINSFNSKAIKSITDVNASVKNIVKSVDKIIKTAIPNDLISTITNSMNQASSINNSVYQLAIKVNEVGNTLSNKLGMITLTVGSKIMSIFAKPIHDLIVYVENISNELSDLFGRDISELMISMKQIIENLPEDDVEKDINYIKDKKPTPVNDFHDMVQYFNSINSSTSNINNLLNGNISSFILNTLIANGRFVNILNDKFGNIVHEIFDDLGCKAILGRLCISISASLPLLPSVRVCVDLCHDVNSDILIFDETQKWKPLKDLKIGDKAITHLGTYETVVKIIDNEKDLVFLFDKTTPSHPRVKLNPDGSVEKYVSYTVSNDSTEIETDFDPNLEIEFARDCRLISIELSGPYNTYFIKNINDKKILYRDTSPELSKSPAASVLLYKLLKKFNFDIDLLKKNIDNIASFIEKTFDFGNLDKNFSSECIKSVEDQINLNLLFKSIDAEINSAFDFRYKSQDNYNTFHILLTMFFMFEHRLKYDEVVDVNFEMIIIDY